MTGDENKKIAVSYNLNLPVEIIFRDGTGIINYLYDASGKKLQKTVTQGGTVTETDYLSGFQYVSKTLDFFPTAEGYVKVVFNRGNPLYQYVFNYTDHLGNIRMSYGYELTSGQLVIMEENHNYPFGMKHEKYNSDQYEFVPTGEGSEYAVGISPLGPNERKTYQYKYNGKEYQDELGLNVYAYGWRDYDPAIGRFLKMDRFAEKYNQISSYAYAGNNPILFRDIAGDSIGLGREHFDRFKNEVIAQVNSILGERQSRIDALIADGKTEKAEKLQADFEKDDTKANSKMNILNQTLTELDALENSPQFYNLQTNSNDVPSGAYGITTYDPGSDAVNVNLKGDFNMGLFGHELKHAYQFQTGALSFTGNGAFGGYLYDLNDEYEAFSRGAFFGAEKLTRAEINSLYKGRPDGPINLNTPLGISSYGHQMRQMTARNSQLGTAQQQFYINWKNDK